VLIRRHGPDAIDDLWQFPDAAGLEIERLTAKQVQHALEAYARYGRGRHPAALNYSDCMSYALARALERPLLYKGSDFGRTDIAEAC
jgi:ribonuclease VapC